MTDKNKPATGSALRRQAEEILHRQGLQTPKQLAALTPEAAQQIVHELQVHQIELEMQNHELRQSQVELKAARARYFDLYDLAPVGYCSVSEPGLIIEANLTAATLLGVARGALVRKPFSRFIFKHDQDNYYLCRKLLLETGQPQVCELRMVRPDGTPLWAQLNAASVQEVGGTPVIRIVLSDASSRKQVEAALHKSEAFNLATLDSLNAEISVLNRGGVIIMVNQPWRRFAKENSKFPGKTARQTGVGVNYLDVCQASSTSNEAALKAFEGIRAVLDGILPVFSMEYPCHAPQEQRWFSMSVTPLGDSVVIAHTNITEHKKAEEALREQEEFFHLIAESIDDFIVVLDLDGRRLYASPSYRQFFGATRDLRGTDSFANIHPQDRERVKQVFSETVLSGIGRQIDYRLQLADGSIREMESNGSVIRDGEGRVARVVVVSRDVTARKQMEEQVRQLAFYDPLTNLPNRRLLNDRLNQALAASTRSGCYGALMFLDLDNFKSLNDTQGHAVGDLLLVEVADRLKSCVRQMDTVARFGGDEFLVMISELHTDKIESTVQARIVAEKIRASLSEPYRLNVRLEGKMESRVEHPCTASIGVALFINHETSQVDILKWADRAMYQAKGEGSNLIRFYE
ncbi:MAG: diguanylate cyclase [Propionivibrio sp.]|uniref:Diguanylate cyclase n=1 Tax=Candidatus Propionivibrio dominans TaxID=2954373 RepID=A0A9D7I7W5_9RHOO|nr:diguanylate cyclase [Candidatus Propionivibrio dominans]